MNSHVMVCVTGQKTCERLIEEGRKVADETDASLSVVHVARQGADFLGNPSESEAIEYLYQVSAGFGADMTLIHANDVAQTIAERANKLNVCTIVLGMRGSDRDFARQLSERLPGVKLHIVYT